MAIVTQQYQPYEVDYDRRTGTYRATILYHVNLEPLAAEGLAYGALPDGFPETVTVAHKAELTPYPADVTAQTVTLVALRRRAVRRKEASSAVEITYEGHVVGILYWEPEIRTTGEQVTLDLTSAAPGQHAMTGTQVERDFRAVTRLRPSIGVRSVVTISAADFDEYLNVVMALACATNEANWKPIYHGFPPPWEQEQIGGVWQMKMAWDAGDWLLLGTEIERHVDGVTTFVLHFDYDNTGYGHAHRWSHLTQTIVAIGGRDRSIGTGIGGLQSADLYTLAGSAEVPVKLNGAYYKFEDLEL